MKHTLLAAAALTLILGGCKSGTEHVAAQDPSVAAEAMKANAENMAMLAKILDAQPEDAKARYDARNPQATLEFIGIKPGMTVAEVLPGGGWYSKIIAPYLGENGHLVGADYDVDMWAKFGGFATDEFLEARKTWSQTWPEGTKEWRGDNAPKISGFALGSAPKDMKNSVDAVIMVRAMHHLNRWDEAFMTDALGDINMILKDDGVVGIVQHRAGEDQPDEWAKGDNGYLKQSFVVEVMKENGFELIAESPVNSNPADKAMAANEDTVWRLPPTLGTSREDPDLQAKMKAIGESDRMTLLFKKN